MRVRRRRVSAELEPSPPAALPAGEGLHCSRSTLSQSGKPMRTQPPGVSASGQPEQLKGVRRNMARVMADAHAKVVPTTLMRRRRPARLDRQAGHHRAPGARHRARLQGSAGAQRVVRRRQAHPHAAPARRHRHRGGHRRRPVRAGVAQRRHARRARRARGHQPPAHAGGGPQHPGLRAERATRSRCPTSACSPAATRRPVVVPPCVAIVGAGKLSPRVVAGDGRLSNRTAACRSR